jgi:hypothetical protein
MIIRNAMTGRVVSVATAIEGSFDTSTHGSGQLEDLTGAQRVTGAMLAQIVDKLHDKGVLSDADIVDLLGWQFTASAE